MSAEAKLANGVLLSERHESFNMPSRKTRSALQPGDCAKVCITFPADELNCTGERLWVQIEKATPSGFVGRVNNVPLCSDMHGLELGDRIRFRHSNILDTYKLEGRAAR